MKLIISESQYKKLIESQEELLSLFEPSHLSLLCKRFNKNENSAACRLLTLKNSLRNKKLENQLENSVEILFKFFPKKTVGLLPKILELSLEYPERTINTLKLISDFIVDPKFKNDVTKKRLLQLRDVNTIPDDLEDILRKAREKEYAKYEKDIVGQQEHFKMKRTSLSLNYSCGDDIDTKFLDRIEKFKVSDPKEFEGLLKKMKFCITDSLVNSKPIKADVVSVTPLFYMDGDEKVKVFDSGVNFEVKKMDTEIDSYLSEFFSIFKNTNYSNLKSSHLEIYNKVIDGVYNWISNTDEGNQYLKKIKEEMSGVIYDNFTIVPSEYIDLYWSNVGQRGCKEKRLSIRFRINPNLKGKTIPIYKYTKGSEILDKKDYVVPEVNTQKVIC
jgi:hypothetical protein